jgi:hypothetical protein
MSEVKHTIREALIAMCYREVVPERWLKPVGHVLFSYLEETNTWKNHFKDIQGKVCIWESHILEDEDPLFRLKEFEAYTRIDIVCGTSREQYSQFQLSSIDI